MTWINNLSDPAQFALFSAVKIICVFSVLMFIVAYAVWAFIYFAYSWAAQLLFYAPFPIVLLILMGRSSAKGDLLT